MVSSIAEIGGRTPVVPLARSAANAASSQAGTGSKASLRSGGAAQPGPPVARLSLGAQTSVQESAKSDSSQQAGKQDPTSEQDLEQNKAPSPASATNQDLTESQQRQVQQLQRRDRVVREHERAHATAGGTFAGPPHFTYATGPDGKQYAVGGEVSIDTSPVPGNPQATIRKMQQVKRAALAPANPSSQDRSVASRADAEILKARQQLNEQHREEQAKQARGQSDRANARNSIGSQDPVFDPERRFRQSTGAGQPVGTGLVGGGELRTNVGLTDPGQLLNLVA